MDTPAILDILRRARALIEEPDHWCKGTFAKVRRGTRNYVPDYGEMDEECNVFCASGAVRHILFLDGGGRIDDEDSRALAQLLSRHIPRDGVRWSVVDFNDRRRTTHGDILAVYDRTITDLERERRERQDL